MHTAVVLSKEVLAIEVIVDLLVRRRVGTVFRRALTYITSIEAEL